jgi:type 1 glutamine amidotransferase
MPNTLLKKLSIVALGVGFLAAAASASLSGQAPAGQGGGGRRGGGAGAPGAAQTPAAPGAPAARGGGGGRGMPQGGRGPIKVLLITKGHPFEREQYWEMWDALGEDLTWTHVEHPAADIMMSPQYAKDYDVLAFYDLGGPGSPTMPRGGGPAPVIPEGSVTTSNNRFYPPPSPELKKNFEALLKQGKGLVFLHHASAAWAHTWPEYSEVIGGACDWYAPTRVRGIDDPNMGYFGMTPQHITYVDKTHPITQGLGDGFDVVDEAYACHWFPDTFHTLAITDFKPADPTKNLNPKVQYSNATAWVKSAENSPVFYTEVGHGSTAWATPGYRALVRNAVKWAASQEALAWAKANPTKIFKTSTN